MARANCNYWQYSRWTYLIGRTVKANPFSTSEREAVITFITGILATRPGITDRLNLKRGCAGELSNQNDWSLGRMVQLIGRQLKVLPPTETEEELCNNLFASTDPRRYNTVALSTSSSSLDEDPDQTETEPEEEEPDSNADNSSENGN